jgi:CRP/FNR family cyclic AMP-dependent transcriptional regulator
MNNSPQNLLSSLRKNELDILFRNGKRESFAKNAIIINEGDLSDSAYIIHSGKVKIILSDSHGKELVLSELTAGDYFGEMALIDQSKRSASVMAMVDTELTVISRQSFRECLRTNPGIVDQIMFGLVTNLRKSNQKISSLVFMSAYDRLANMLLALAKDKDGSLVIDKHPTQQHIAGVVGVSREMISRIFKSLVDDGHIKVMGKRIMINRTGPFCR